MTKDPVVGLSEGRAGKKKYGEKASSKNWVENSTKRKKKTIQKRLVPERELG